MATQDEPANDALVSQGAELLKAELMATVAMNSAVRSQPSRAMPQRCSVMSAASRARNDTSSC